MRNRGFPIVVNVGGQRVDAGIRAASNEQPVVVALRLRDRGWDPYKVFFDAEAGAWIALVLEKRGSRERSAAPQRAVASKRA